MTALFDLGHARYPLRRIERLSALRKGKEGGRIHYLKLKDEEDSQQVYAGDVDRILVTPTQIISAALGTFLLRVWIENDVPVIARTPVIGWALCFDRQVRPVTPVGVGDGLDEPDADFYTEMPDGSVQACNAYSEPTVYVDAEAYRVGQGERLAQDDRARAAPLAATQAPA